MKKKKIGSYLILPLLILLVVAIFALNSYLKEQKRLEHLKNFYNMIGAGWNLGNTLDVHKLHRQSTDPLYFETYWGNPVTTKEIIESVKAQGFDTIRIPVTWYVHTDGDFNIDAAWMARVKQVVDMALESGLNVIINAHHDTWYIPLEENYDNAKLGMQKIWSQIAQEFAAYDGRLMFESMNEPRLIGTKNEWTAGTQEARDIVNELNAVFVQTVREQGGNNATRYLLIPTYCAEVDEATVSDMIVPQDKNIAVSVHIYKPYSFAHEVGKQSTWSADEAKDAQVLDTVFELLDEAFIQKGIPVIITEYGAVDKNNLADRERWTQYVVSSAREKYIPCIWWDAGGNSDKKLNHILFDRFKMQWLYPSIVETIMQNSKNF